MNTTTTSLVHYKICTALQVLEGDPRRKAKINLVYDVNDYSDKTIGHFLIEYTPSKDAFHVPEFKIQQCFDAETVSLTPRLGDLFNPTYSMKSNVAHFIEGSLLNLSKKAGKKLQVRVTYE